MTLYEVFFSRKYCQRPNSIVTIAKQQEINTNCILDKTTDTSCEQDLIVFTLANVFHIYLENEVDDKTHVTDRKNESKINIKC